MKFIYISKPDVDVNLLMNAMRDSSLAISNAKVASAQSALQWTNPELEAEHETLSNDFIDEAETTIALSKSFMSPWSGSAHKKARDYDIQAAEFEHQHRQLTLLAEWKYTYVDLQLKQKLQQRLTEYVGVGF